MKKKFYLLILFVLTAIMLIGCTNVNGNPIKSIEVMDVNSMVFELNEKIDYKNLKIRITYEDGTTRERQAFEWMTKGLDTTKLGERAFTVKYGKFIVTCKYEVVSQKYFTIKFDVQGGSDKVEDQEVFYKSTIVEPEVPSKEGFIFLGWYNGEVEFDIKTPIMQDYVLTAKWALDLEEYQMFVIRKINMMVELITKEVDYIPADYINIINIANEAIDDIIASSTKEEIDNIYGNIQFAINNIPMIPQLLTIRFNEIIAGDYFVEDAAIIEGIYNEAVVAIDEYKNGVPTPYTIYLNAVKAMEEVFTKVEDIELSVFMKASRIKDMKFYANNKGEMYYTPMQWEALKVIVAGEVINIENAIGTREVAKAYAVALSKIDAAERLDEGRYNKVSELVVALNSYDINNYFVTEWMEMNEIYEDAIYGIRTYEGGVPSVEYIVSTAIAAMAEVNTKAEDKALAEIMKGTRLKDLAQYAQSKGEIYYSNENWTELMNLATITAAEYFSYCESTHDVASTYVDLIFQIDMVEHLPDPMYSNIVALTVYVNGLKSTDYFEVQWIEINQLYVNAAALIKAYVEGEPNPETICANAIAAIDAVLTKAEDIALADTMKAEYITRLEAYVGNLVEANYTAQNWQNIQNIMNDGKDYINNTQGTAQLQAMYDNIIDSINSIETIPAI